MIKIIELFAGIGSQTQALKNIGVEHDVVGICEIDKYAEKSYKAIHGDVENFGDITKVDSLPDADLWTYSFPCTDLSIAGKQKGLSRGSGTRSGLLWKVERLLLNSDKPKFLLMENVKPLVGEKFAEGFNEWRRSLASMGYRNYYQVLNAKDYGIPQNRERVFMVSILGPGEPFCFPEKEILKLRLNDILEDVVDDKFYLSVKMIGYLSNQKEEQDKCGNGFGFTETDKSGIAKTLRAQSSLAATDNIINCGNIHPSGNGMNGQVYDSKGVAPTITTNKGEGPKVKVDVIAKIPASHDYCGRVYSEQGLSPALCTMGGGGQEPKIFGSVDRIRKLTPLECWRLMGFSDEAFYLAAAVCSNSQLYKQAGNSIVVDVLERIFRSMFLEDKGNVQDTQMEFL